MTVGPEGEPNVGVTGDRLHCPGVDALGDQEGDRAVAQVMESYDGRLPASPSSALNARTRLRAPIRSNAPKVTLISRTQVLLQEGRLHFAATHPLIQTLRQELLEMRVKVSPTAGRDTY